MHSSLQNMPRWALLLGMSILVSLLSASGAAFFNNSAKVAEDLQSAKIQLGRIEEHVRRIEGIQLSQSQAIQQAIIFAQERGERLSKIEADMLTTKQTVDMLQRQLFQRSFP